jgi:hypothetical protein
MRGRLAKTGASHNPVNADGPYAPWLLADSIVPHGTPVETRSRNLQAVVLGEL